MSSADLLILLSDVAGLYNSPQHRNAHARLLPVVERITPEEFDSLAENVSSELSRGGMRTKIEAARIATAAGTHMAIADGRIAHPIARIAEGGRCTWSLTPSNPIAARKIWIGGSLELKGAVFVNRRRWGAGPRQEPAPGRGHTRGGCFRAWRLRRNSRPGRGRDRTRPHRL